MEGFVLLALQTEHEATSRGTQAVSAAPPYGPQEVRPPPAAHLGLLISGTVR